MCGICGVFYPKNSEFEPPSININRACQRLAMRGPDMSGISIGKGYALGHRRLSILDLSISGSQPMKCKNEEVEIVFNGEIYNYASLKSELQDLNYIFSTTTDTEVLIYGYKEWGLNELLHRIHGMYAFAILDHVKWQLHLARDPLGQKPLFYQWTGQEFIFSSLAGALTELHSQSINHQAIDNLLFSMSISGHHTIFENVFRVEPGCSITVCRDGTVKHNNYWKPDFSNVTSDLSIAQWLDATDSALKKSVQRCLVSDVPIGILLSGGIDSSLVTSYASEMMSTVNTFSVATEDPLRDESVYAKSVALHCATKHHELKVTGNVRHLLPQLIAAMGEPFADASAINLIAISSAAREHIKVVLTGDGGDEGFGGYKSFLAYHMADQLREVIPHWGYPPLSRLLTKLQGMHPIFRKISTILRFSSAPLSETFMNGWVDDRTRNELFTVGMKKLLDNYDPKEHYRQICNSITNRSMADSAMQAHMITILPDDYLAKVDYATMAVGLEARSPFLDRELIDLATKIPSSILFHDYQTKSILRKLANKRLPRNVVNRPKAGFVTPVWLWIVRDWRDLVQEFILGSHVEHREWFRRASLEKLVLQHSQNPRVNTGYLLWSLMVLEMWIRMHVENTFSASEVL